MEQFSHSFPTVIPRMSLLHKIMLLLTVLSLAPAF